MWSWYNGTIHFSNHWQCLLRKLLWANVTSSFWAVVLSQPLLSFNCLAQSFGSVTGLFNKSSHEPFTFCCQSHNVRPLTTHTQKNETIHVTLWMISSEKVQYHSMVSSHTAGRRHNYKSVNVNFGSCWGLGLGSRIQILPQQEEKYNYFFHLMAASCKQNPLSPHKVDMV